MKCKQCQSPMKAMSSQTKREGDLVFMDRACMSKSCSFTYKSVEIPRTMFDMMTGLKKAFKWLSE